MVRKVRPMVCPACGARMTIYGPSDRAWHVKCPKKPLKAPPPEYVDDPLQQEDRK